MGSPVAILCGGGGEGLPAIGPGELDTYPSDSAASVVHIESLVIQCKLLKVNVCKNLR